MTNLIRDRYRPAPTSVKDEKPKPVKRAKGKDIKPEPRDMQPARRGGTYKTR